MIDEEQYFETVKSYFGFLTIEFDFKISKDKVIGNAFYEVRYRESTRIVSISYENIEDVFLVIIFMLENGELPNYDDKTKTLHLNKLNTLVLKSIDKDEIGLNNEHFLQFHPYDDFEKKILKSAKELRLCLRNFNIIQSSLITPTL